MKPTFQFNTTMTIYRIYYLEYTPLYDDYDDNEDEYYDIPQQTLVNEVTVKYCATYDLCTKYINEQFYNRNDIEYKVEAIQLEIG